MPVTHVTSDEMARSLPYLGPLPQPSRVLGASVQLASIVLAVVALYRALLCWQVVEADPRSLAGGATFGVASSVRAAADTADLLHWVLFVGMLLAAIALGRPCHRARRPVSRADEQGETYVETWLTQVLPLWFRLPASGVAQGGFVLLVFAYPPAIAGPPADVYRAQLIASLALVAGNLGNVVVVSWADRVFRGRVMGSGPVRTRAELVPPVARVDAGADPWHLPRGVRTVTFIGAVFVGVVAASARSLALVYALTAALLVLSCGQSCWGDARRRRAMAAAAEGRSDPFEVDPGSPFF